MTVVFLVWPGPWGRKVPQNIFFLRWSCTFFFFSGGGCRKGGSCNNRFVLKPDIAIASEASIFSKNSLAITDFLAKKTQLVNYWENPLPGSPPFAIRKFREVSGKDKAHRHKQFCRVIAWVRGGVLPTGWPGVKCLCAVCRTKEHKYFRPGSRPGGPVAGVTEKLFMCQMFMCLFRPYIQHSTSLFVVV